MKTKRWSYLQSLLAVLVFATGQYRLLCVLLLVCINKNCIKSRPLMVRFKSSYKLLLILLFLAIFTVIPNYLQRGRPQLAYINKEGHRMCVPINVYLLNVLFPEESDSRTFGNNAQAQGFYTMRWYTSCVVKAMVLSD